MQPIFRVSYHSGARPMRKQLDPRIPILINNNVKKNHRSFIVLVGDKGRDQVSEGRLGFIPIFTLNH